MLGVTSEGYGLVTFSAGVSEQVNKTVVIGGCNQSLIIGESYMVNMGSISSRRENSIN